MHGLGINSNPTSTDYIRQYTFPVLRENKDAWYVEFYAYDPLFAKMRRKRIKINRVKQIKARRQYARDLINRIVQQLMQGWNPWIEQDCENLMLFTETIERYTNSIRRMHEDGLYRKSTYENYMSHLQKFINYNNQRPVPIYYLYQMDIKFCNDYLEHIYIRLKYSAQYRNNCLVFIKAFCRWCVTKGLMKTNPASEITPFSQKLCKKKREAIPKETLMRISKYLAQHDKPFLLSCYLLYYCCIRPGEQVKLLLSDINIKESTITMRSEISKNRNTQTITMPKKVLHLMLDMKVFDNPPNWHLFSSNIKPGEKSVSRRMLSKHWDSMRTKLKLKEEYQYYSLKDTGITDMLSMHVSNIAVRDQARHGSLSITNIYARNMNKSANQEILNLDGEF